METIKSGNYTFEIVDAVPAGFAAWNIPQIDEGGEYLPLFEKMHPEDPSSHYVNTETLKAVKMAPGSVARIRRAASCGVRTLKDAERAAKSKRSGRVSNMKREAAVAAMDDFRDLWSR